MIPPLRYVCMTSESQTCYNRSKVTYKLSTTTKGGSKGPLFSFAYILPTLLHFPSITIYFHPFQNEP